MTTYIIVCSLWYLVGLLSTIRLMRSLGHIHVGDLPAALFFACSGMFALAILVFVYMDAKIDKGVVVASYRPFHDTECTEAPTKASNDDS